MLASGLDGTRPLGCPVSQHWYHMFFSVVSEPKILKSTVCFLINFEMEGYSHDLNPNFCLIFFVQHLVLAYKFDSPLGNMEGISSYKIWNLVGICNSDHYICCLARRHSSCVLEALQVGKP